MKRLLFLFSLWPAVAFGQTTASVNPQPGTVYTYIGPSLGADWLPVSVSSNIGFYENTPWYNPNLGFGLVNVILGCDVGQSTCNNVQSGVGAVANFQRHGALTDSADANPVLTGSLIPMNGLGGNHGTGVMGIVKDAYGHTNVDGHVFYEGVRGQCDLLSTAFQGFCEGSVSEAEAAFGSNYYLLVGHEAAVNNNTGVDYPAVFTDLQINAAFLASCGDHGQEGHTSKCGMAFMVNANSAVPFQYGFVVPRNPNQPTNSVAIADFYSQNTAGLYGLELGEGSFAVAAVHLPNANWISFKTANGLDDVHTLTVDENNNVLVGNDDTVNSVVVGPSNGNSVFLRTNQTTMDNAAPLAAFDHTHTNQLQLLVLDATEHLNIAPESNLITLVQIGNVDGSVPLTVNSTLFRAPNLPSANGLGGCVGYNATTKQLYVSSGTAC